MFGDIQLNNLNDSVVQRRIDEYAKNHSRKTTHEVLLKTKTALSDAYTRGYLANDFACLVKSQGKVLEKHNLALSITKLKKLRIYVIHHTDNEFKSCAAIFRIWDASWRAFGV